MYVYQNGWHARAEDTNSWTEVLKDRKFAAALLEKWRPSHDGYATALDPGITISPYLPQPMPELVEAAARGEYVAP
jgi:hypothetical protein